MQIVDFIDLNPVPKALAGIIIGEAKGRGTPCPKIVPQYSGFLGWVWALSVERAERAISKCEERFSNA
jgi:hypothetical protein